MDFFENLSKADIISFDIFDTLIVRPYIKPTDLFKHMEYVILSEGNRNVKGFYENRIKGEAKARKELIGFKGKQEISINDIYHNMDPKYLFLKDMEINWEIMVCRANPIMLDLYNKLIKLGKKIIFTSDMYLPLSVVKKILQNAQFGDHPIYLSSELNLTKANSSIYYKLLQEYNGKNIIHIGDNFFTDVINAKSCGINAKYLVRPLDYFLSQDYVSPFIKALAERDDISASIAVGLNVILWLNNYTRTPKTDEDKALNLGRAEVFLLLVPFVQWINNNITKKNKNGNLYFLSRSGEIIQKIYSILHPKSKSDYLYISRKIAISLLAVHDYDIFIFYILSQVNYKNRDEAISTIYNNVGVHYPKLLEDLENLKNVNKIFAKGILQKHKKNILKLLEQNNSVYIRYLDSINFLNKKTQPILVDTGWSGTIQESLSTYLRYNHYSTAENLQGYYIGLIKRKYTHFNYNYNNKTFHKYIPSGIVEKYYDYMLYLVELFTYHSNDTTCISIEEKDNKFIPIFAASNQFELHKNQIAHHMQKGVTDILELYKSIFDNYPIPETSDDVLDLLFSSIIDKSNHSSYSFIWDLSETRTISATDIVQTNKPFSAKPGIVIPYVWGNAPSGELELIYKFKRIEQTLGVTVYIVNENNFLFDNTGNITNQQLNITDKNIFMYLELHMTSFKKLDTLSSMALVNPPEFVMKWDTTNDFYYRMASHNLYMYNGSNDNFNFVKNYLNNKGIFSKDLIFYPSCSEKDILPPADLYNPKIFYITTNWTAWDNLETRYESLLFLLDTSDIPCSFYGPKIVNGIEVWHGVKNYRGSLPFDGISTIRAINDCGVCICFSSDVHLHWASVSSRLYEAIAGGAIAIVDNNPFIREKFGDCVLYVDTTLSEKAIFLQIKKHISYIKANQEHAISMILKAQEILRKEFVFERQVENWISSSPKVKNHLSIQTFSQATNVIDIVLIILHENINSIQKSIQNIKNQSFNKIRLILVYDNTLEILLNTILNCIPSSIEIVNVSLSIFNPNSSFKIYLGEIIDSIKHYITSKYFYINLVERYIDCTLFNNHITTLVRSLEDNEEALAVTGSSSVDILPEHIITLNHPVYSYNITSVTAQKALLMNTVFKTKLLKQLELLKYFHVLFDLYMFDQCNEDIIFNTEVTAILQINKNHYYNSINTNYYNIEKRFLDSITKKNYQLHVEAKVISSIDNSVMQHSTPKYHNTIMIGKFKILSYRKLSNFINLIKKEKIIRIGKFKILSYRKLNNFINKLFN